MESSEILHPQLHSKKQSSIKEVNVKNV
jgi:hypothetical protein